MQTKFVSKQSLPVVFGAPRKSKLPKIEVCKLLCPSNSPLTQQKVSEQSWFHAHPPRSQHRCNAAVTEPDTQTTESWSKFCRAASGEFEGCAATFDAQGQPVELPPYYVPDAFREWGQKLFDWQTQSSTITDGTTLRRKVKRLMPTVGCEADAVAFKEEERVTAMQPHSSAADTPAFCPDGSWSIPADLKGDSERAYSESCFATGEGHRLRIVQVLRPSDRGWNLAEIEVHKEKWDGEYNGGQELRGCGGGMPSFAEKPRLDAEALTGRWVPAEEETLPEQEPGKPGMNAVWLPLDGWSSIEQGEDELVLTTGCLLSVNERYRSRQQYRSNAVTHISLRKERRAE